MDDSRKPLEKWTSACRSVEWFGALNCRGSGEPSTGVGRDKLDGSFPSAIARRSKMPDRRSRVLGCDERDAARRGRGRSRDRVLGCGSAVRARPSAHLSDAIGGSGRSGRGHFRLFEPYRAGVTARHYDLYDRAREKRAALELWGRQVARIIDGVGKRAGTERRQEAPGCNPRWSGSQRPTF